MGAPDDLDHDENWYGGFYELAINLGPRNAIGSDERLQAALQATWRAAPVKGCYERDGRTHRPVALSLSSLMEQGHLHGTVGLPDGSDLVCGAVAVREDDGDDWLDFYLPMGALADLDPRVGAFPFGDEGGAPSREWREPLDLWLGAVATEVHAAARYSYAVIGFEVSGFSLEEALGSDGQYYRVLLERGSGLENLPVTRWDFGTPV